MYYLPLSTKRISSSIHVWKCIPSTKRIPTANVPAIYLTTSRVTITSSYKPSQGSYNLLQVPRIDLLYLAPSESVFTLRCAAQDQVIPSYCKVYNWVRLAQGFKIIYSHRPTDSSIKSCVDSKFHWHMTLGTSLKFPHNAQIDSNRFTLANTFECVWFKVSYTFTSE